MNLFVLVKGNWMCSTISSWCKFQPRTCSRFRQWDSKVFWIGMEIRLHDLGSRIL